MCVHLDGLNAEHKFRVWLATRHFTFFTFTFSFQGNQTTDDLKEQFTFIVCMYDVRYLAKIEKHTGLEQHEGK